MSEKNEQNVRGIKEKIIMDVNIWWDRKVSERK